MSARIPLLLIFMVLETLCFRFNILDVASPGHFQGFADGTESFVLARLAWSEKYGVLKDGGVLLWDVGIPPGRSREHYYRSYVDDVPITEPRFYQSRPNIQGPLFSGFDRISPFDDDVNLCLFYWFASVLSACCITYFLAWILSEFGATSFALSATAFLFAPWFTVSGGHLFWFSGLFFLPFGYISFGLRRHPTQLSARFLFLVAFLFLVKSLFIGYELITASLVMCTMPVFYYAIRDGWPRFRLVSQFAWVSGSICVGLLLSIGVLLLQTSKIDSQQQQTGVAVLVERFMIRTIGTTMQGKTPAPIAAAREASYPETMEKYWHQPLLRAPFLEPGSQGFSKLVLRTDLLLLAGIALFSLALFVPNARALAITTVLSYLAPASWFLIFKAHAFRHPFLDPIAWFLPTVPLIFALTGLLISIAAKRLDRRRVTAGPEVSA